MSEGLLQEPRDPKEPREPPEAPESREDAASSAAGYNTHAVERLTGVPATTFRAWERRYGVPSPRRQPGGQRIYAERDVAVVRWLREQTDRGLSASLAVAQLRQAPATVDPAIRSSFPPAELSSSMVQAALGFDSTALDRTLSHALAAHPLETVCLEVVQPALVEVGERWHRGEVSPAVEHFATALIRRRLEQLASILDSGTGRPLVILGAAPGEQHEVGAMILGLFLRRRGLRVIYLGPNVSVEAAVEVTRRLRPDLFCLSATTPAAAQAVREVGDALAALDEPRPRFAFGGLAFLADASLGEGIKGTFLGRDAAEATAAAELLLRDGRSGHPDSAAAGAG